MKNKLLLFSAVFGLMLFTACGKPDNSSVSHPAVSQAAPAGSDMIQLFDADQRAASCGTADGFYQVSPSATSGTLLLYYVDYATASRLPLCSAPNCTHDSDACTAVVGSTSLFVHKDKLYLIERPMEAPETLMQMELDGTGRHTIVTLENGEQFAHTGVAANDTSLFFEVLSTDDTTGLNGNYRTCRYDLSTGQLNVLRQSEGTNEFLLGVCGPYMVMKSFAFDEATLQLSGTRFYLVDETGAEQSLTLPEWAQAPSNGVLTVSAFVADDLIYLLKPQEGSLFAFDPITQACAEIFREAPLLQTAGELRIATVKDGNFVLENGQDCYFYANDQLTKSTHSYYRSDLLRSCLIFAEHGDQYLVGRDLNLSPYGLELVPKSEYWADADSGTPIQG